MKNRRDLAKHFNELGFKVGAEIGVDAGAYAKVLCEEIPGLKYYGIDIWELDTRHLPMRIEKHAEAEKLLAPYDVTLIKKFSLDALSDFEDNSLDFVYIDAGHHFDEVMKDIMGWTKKVRKGGIVAGHDYTPADMGRNIVAAVDAYLQGHGLSLQVTTDTDEGVSWLFNKKWRI